MKSKKSSGVIIIIAVMLLAIMFMDTWMVFGQTRQQTKDSGTYQLENISGELESTISEAEKLTMSYALSVQEYLSNKDALSYYIYKQKAELLKKNSGAFNLYVAGSDWSIIPDFNMPDDYVITERLWYTGALRNGGNTYVTPPYQDAMTGDICYSVSVLLGDGETVLAVDYTMENIQAHIMQMYSAGSHNAVIITDEGIIAGCNDENLIGKQLVSALPDYAGIWSLSKNTDGVASVRIRDGILYENLFATKSGNGWYLIVSESDWALYHDSYIQLIITLLLSLALFSVIILLYFLAVRNRKKAEAALASRDEFLSNITSELKKPLSKILDSSSSERIRDMDDYNIRMAGIHSAGEQLFDMIGQIISYSGIVRSEKGSDPKKKKSKIAWMNLRFRRIIIIFMTLIMIVSLYSNVSATYRGAQLLMIREAEKYEFRLSEWINTQKSILDMFVSIISTNPDMLDDYEGTVDTLNRITSQYPEISVTYMTNPEFEHTVYMNNGWEPDEDWRVEERQWYIDTMAAEDGWSISAPYYDEQTGGYCVTISERVYDAKTGEFLGNFGIDFFMDKLVDVLGGSYSDHGYAFLVDTNGDIINHPYGGYQMSLDSQTNVSDPALPYSESKADGSNTVVIKDYDGSYRILLAIKNDVSRFRVYVVSDIWTIYGQVVIYGIICLVSFTLCIILIYRLLTDMIRWQNTTNEQIKETADAAIAAGKAKSQFLAQMSHEIRTPINAVLGMNEMILRESDDSDIREYAENIRSSGKNLLSIINSILDFSRIEDGKMEIIPVKYELAGMINNLVNSVAERAKAKSLEFSLHVDEKLPAVLLGDDVRLTQVIVNLLTNAVKYTEKGTVSLNIYETGREGPQITLGVKVSDTGIGIKQEDMSRLFETFERLEEKRNRNIEGTGLGISIVTKLLHMMGSELKVESEYGTGSVFSFEIRQTIVDEQPLGDYTQRIKKKALHKDEQMHIFAPSAKVLVVDDNEMNLKVAKSLMKLNGFVPDTASSGKEAMEKARKNTYHIIFLDHMMPEMDGIETLSAMKNESLIPDGTTVIALTANAIAGAKESYMKAGFDDYLSKPIEVAGLEEKLSEYLPEDITEWKANGNKAVSAAKEDKEVMEFDASDDEVMEFMPEEDKTQTSAKDITGELTALGIDINSGLMYCAGEMDFYTEILKEYVKSYAEKRNSLDTFLKENDLNNYKIVVHSLKSSSKTIGAMDLSEQARLLEEASGNGDNGYVLAKHDAAMNDFDMITSRIADILMIKRSDK